MGHGTASRMDRLCRRAATRLCFIGQMPQVAMFLKLSHNVIGHGVPLCFGQSLFEAANDLPGAA
jgi:hypothetical protein